MRKNHYKSCHFLTNEKMLNYLNIFENEMNVDGERRKYKPNLI